MNAIEHAAMMEARRMMLAATSSSQLENDIAAALAARDTEITTLALKVVPVDLCLTYSGNAEQYISMAFLALRTERDQARTERDSLKAEAEKLRSVLDWDNRIKQAKTDQAPIRLEMVGCEECANLKALLVEALTLDHYKSPLAKRFLSRPEVAALLKEKP